MSKSSERLYAKHEIGGRSGDGERGAVGCEDGNATELTIACLISVDQSLLYPSSVLYQSSAMNFLRNKALRLSMHDFFSQDEPN
jgi:hypothetical protein